MRVFIKFTKITAALPLLNADPRLRNMTKKKYFYILKPAILGVYVLLSTPSTKPTMNAAFTAARVL